MSSQSNTPIRWTAKKLRAAKLMLADQGERFSVATGRQVPGRGRELHSTASVIVRPTDNASEIIRLVQKMDATARRLWDDGEREAMQLLNDARPAPLKRSDCSPTDARRRPQRQHGAR